MSFRTWISNPKVLNPLLSIFDREARELVRRIVVTVPNDSWLRSEVFGRAFDVIRGMAEGANFGAFTPLIEKLSDYGDALAGDLTDKKAEAKTEDVLLGWMNKFFTEAGERLKNAPDPTAESKKIQKEFRARIKLLKIIEAEAKKLAEEKKGPDKKPPDAKPIEFGKAVDDMLGGWKANAQRRGYAGRRKP